MIAVRLRHPPFIPGCVPATGSGSGSPAESFDFLEFTHFGSQSKKGNWVVQRKTADSRLHRAVKQIAEWCRLNRHRPMREQYEALTRKLQGHYQYYGVIGNLASLHRFYYEVLCLWRKWLSRRKRRGQLTWERYCGLPRVFVLPWPHAPAYPPAANP